MHRFRASLAGLTALALVTACAEQPPQPTGPAEAPSMASAGTGTLLGFLEQVNADLEAAGAPYRVEKAELSLAPTAPADMASVVFVNDRTLRLASKWVPGDPRRGGRTTLLQYFFSPLAAVNTNVGSANSQPAVEASFDTWEALSCFPLDIQKRPYDGAWPSAILTLGGQPGNPFVADVNTIGFLPGSIFDAVLGPGASTNVLGVTITFTFIQEINGDGRGDTAFKEVWYNNAFTWTLTGDPNFIDVETVALHENGHALELGHFGKIHASFSPHGGRLHVSPRAVMNAAILGTLREPLGTDKASLCSNFASWPF